MFPLQQRITPVLQGVGIEPTNYCNLKCRMCWSQTPQVYPPRRRGYMKWSLYRKCIDEFADYCKLVDVKLSLCLNYGGESMLHPKFCNMIRYAFDKNCFRTIRSITNATLLTPKICETIVDCRVHTTVSIHDCPETVAAYNKVAELVRLRDMRERPVIDGAIVQNEFDGDELLWQLKHWTQILDDVTVYPLHSETLQYVDWDKGPDKFCAQPTYYMAVLWDGTVYPCCHLFSTDFKGMGNVSEEGVLNVWRGERYELLRAGKLPDAPCKHCELI